MTPEDVKAERIKLFQIDTHIKANGPWHSSDSYADFNALAPCADRVMKWENGTLEWKRASVTFSKHSTYIQKHSTRL